MAMKLGDVTRTVMGNSVYLFEVCEAPWYRVIDMDPCSFLYKQEIGAFRNYEEAQDYGYNETNGMYEIITGTALYKKYIGQEILPL